MEKSKAREYYDANKELFRGADISHILVDTEEQAKEVLARIKAGEDFAKLARELSKCPSGQQGGSLGRVPDMFYVPGFAAALPGLKTVGQLAGPVRSQFGYHVIRLEGGVEQVPFEAVAEMLEHMLPELEKRAAGKDYPSARKGDFSEVLGGYENRDPYAWMENKDDAETLAWVAEENKYTDAWFAGKGVESLAAEMKSAAVKVDYMLPHYAHGRIYTTRTDADGKHMPVILDEEWNELAEIGAELLDRFMLFGADPCPTDADIVALRASPFGAHIGSVLLYSLSRKEIILRVDDSFGAVWTPDGALWYAQSLPHREEGYNENPVWRRPPEGGTPVKVYDPPRDRAYVIITEGPDNCVMIDSKFDFGSNELLIAYPDGRVESVTGEVRAKNEYCGTHGGVHYINTDEGAPLGKLVGGGRTVIPESKRMLIAAAVTERGLLAAFMEDVCLRLELYDFDGKKLEDVELPDRFGSMGAMGAFVRSEAKKLCCFTFESFTTPPVICAYDEKSGKVRRLFSAYSDKVPEDIIVEQIFVTARDGERVPAFAVRRKDAERNGKNPVHMYGYGGYNLAMPPSYKNMVTGMKPWEWAAKGGIYVNCNLRGGNEYGSRWHEAGMLKNKMNAFNDFIDTAEYMIAEGWTSAGRIIISGCSNGGLLMSVLITLRPDLWGVVIDSVPHTDMLRFVNDPAGPRYITEYGNPRDADMLPYLLGYSPYHNIRVLPYPPIYIQTGERDNNVPPYHAKKFAARMQEFSSGGPALLRVLAEGSHDRGQGDVMYRTMAEMQIFAEKALENK